MADFTERSIRLHYTIPNLVIAVSSIFINCFLIHALRKLNLLQTISYRLITVLSVSDIFIGFALLVTEPSYILFSKPSQQFMLNLCTGVSLFTFCQFSGFMIILIAVDRFIHMKYSVNYPVIITNRRAMKLVIFNIAFSLSLTATYVCALVYNFVFVYYLSMASIASVAFITLSVLYYNAYRSTKISTTSLESSQVNIRKSSREFTRAVLFILGSLWICYSPFVAFSIIRHSHAVDNVYAASVGFFGSELLIYLNSTINAVLFIAFNTKLKEYSLSFLRCASNRH